MKKTVLITCASSGFGKASAKFFAKKGWNVVATLDIGPLVKARRESSEAAYIALMRSQFMPKTAAATAKAG